MSHIVYSKKITSKLPHSDSCSVGWYVALNLIEPVCFWKIK